MEKLLLRRALWKIVNLYHVPTKNQGRDRNLKKDELLILK